MKDKIIDRIRNTLSWRWLPLLAILLGTVLVLPALNTGLALDDYIHQMFFDKEAELGGIERNVLDIFTFSSGDPKQRQQLMDEGVFSWWTAKDMKASFFRPLSSLSHLLDHYLWPNSPMLKHLHSILWFVLLLILVSSFYRQFHTSWVAGLALLLFAIDDAHGLTVSFIANRNALIAAVFGLASLLCYHQFRRKKWPAGRYLSPLLLALGLLAGEACLAMAGYLLAYALFIDEGSIRERVSGLLPHLFVGLIWAALYISLGFGVKGSGLYLSPIGEFFSFLQVLWQRLPILLLGLFGFPPSDLWNLYSNALANLLLGLAFLGIFTLIFLWRHLLRLNPTYRFYALGTLLAIIPVCATFTSDRNLLIPGLGAMGLLGSFMGSFLDSGKTQWQKERKSKLKLLPRLALVYLVVIHLVLAPLLLPFRSYMLKGAMEDLHRINASIPRKEAIRDKKLVIVNPLMDMLYLYIPFMRQVQREQGPKVLRLLATGIGQVAVTRIDPFTLEIKPEAGFLKNKWERMFRGPNDPMKIGDTITLSDMEVKVTDVTSDGRAAVARFRFGLPLEDPSFVWMRCENGLAPIPYMPPKVGETHSLKIKIDLLGGTKK